MSTAYPSFHFHPSSPTGLAPASSSSPVRPGRALLAGGVASKAASAGRVVPFGRQATPPTSSSPPAKLLGTKRAAGGPAPGQAPTKRLVLGSLHPNALVPVSGGGHARRKQPQGASAKVISGYATPTSSSPVRPTARRQAAGASLPPSSDDLEPTSSPPLAGRRPPAPLLERLVAPSRAADAPLLPRAAQDASPAVDTPTTTTSSAFSSSLAVPTFATSVSSSSRSTSTSSASSTVLHAPVPLSPTHTFLLGRTRSAHPLQPKPFGPVTPAVLSQLLRPQAAVLRLPLPRSAKHASRTHVAVELVGPALARVLVLGLNGARVQGRRVPLGEAVLVDGLRQGEVRRVEDGAVLKQGSSSGRAGPLRIGFWGVEVVFQWPAGSLINSTNGAAPVLPDGKSRTAPAAVSADADETESEARSSSASERSSSSESDEDMNLHSSEEDEDDEAAFQPAVRPASSSVLPPSSPPLSLASASSPPAALPAAVARRFVPSQLARSTPSSPSAAPLSASSASSAAVRSRPATPVSSSAAAPIKTAKIILTRPPTTAATSQPTSTSAVSTPLPTTTIAASVKPAKPAPATATPSGTVFKPEPREAPLPVAAATPPAPTRPAPSAVDLPSLLSSALVFSHVTSLAVPDLVRAVLETSPSLKEHGSIDDWEAWVFEEVNKGGMWGRVIRRGKVRRFARYSFSFRC
jgi:hypothetical protein